MSSEPARETAELLLDDLTAAIAVLGEFAGSYGDFKGFSQALQDTLSRFEDGLSGGMAEAIRTSLAQGEFLPEHKAALVRLRGDLARVAGRIRQVIVGPDADGARLAQTTPAPEGLRATVSRFLLHDDLVDGVMGYRPERYYSPNIGGDGQLADVFSGLSSDQTAVVAVQMGGGQFAYQTEAMVRIVRMIAQARAESPAAALVFFPELLEVLDRQYVTEQDAQNRRAAIKQAAEQYGITVGYSAVYEDAAGRYQNYYCLAQPGQETLLIKKGNENALREIGVGAHKFFILICDETPTWYLGPAASQPSPGKHILLIPSAVSPAYYLRDVYIQPWIKRGFSPIIGNNATGFRDSGVSVVVDAASGEPRDYPLPNTGAALSVTVLSGVLGQASAGSRMAEALRKSLEWLVKKYPLLAYYHTNDLPWLVATFLFWMSMAPVTLAVMAALLYFIFVSQNRLPVRSIWQTQAVSLAVVLSGLAGSYAVLRFLAEPAKRLERWLMGVERFVSDVTAPEWAPVRRFEEQSMPALMAGLPGAGNLSTGVRQLIKLRAYEMVRAGWEPDQIATRIRERVLPELAWLEAV
ncbi:MAG: hypothetical protein WCG06_06115, partial [Candidatus Omnitrophota bacterium]